MIKILLLIDYSSEFDRKLLRGLVQYSKENGPWLFYRLPSYYSAMYGERGILEWAKKWKADANHRTVEQQYSRFAKRTEYTSRSAKLSPSKSHLF